jgi:hypothetical protein
MTSVVCTSCGKQLSEIKIITEVQVEIFSQYVTPQGTMENMNGQWKKVREQLCEGCLAKLVAALQSLHQ